jgi:hypothetical protein
MQVTDAIRKFATMSMIIMLSQYVVIAQEHDTIPVPERINVVAFNPTPMLLFNNLKNITLVYERLIKPNQSLVFQAGYLAFRPELLDSLFGNAYLSSRSNKGFNFAFQYRFYLSRLNRKAAPFGLYLGPYASYYGLMTKSTVSIPGTTPYQSENITAKYNMVNLGFGLGYQFVFRKKITLDMLVFGPSMSYSFQNKQSDGNLSKNEEALISDMVQDDYLRHYPLLSQFINAFGNSSSATFTTFFRYAVTIGYNF